MARTKITNISTGPLALPPPYFNPMAPGGAIVVGDDQPTVIANLGPNPGLWRIDAEPDSGGTSPLVGPISATDIGPGAVSTPALDPGVIQQVAITLTSAQVKALNTTPITLVPAQGAGKVIVPIDVSAYLKFGTSAFVEATAGEVLQVKHAGGVALWQGGLNTTFIQATASEASDFNFVAAAQASINEAKTATDNVALVVQAQFAITGNAANDNIITIVVTYRVDTVVW